MHLQVSRSSIRLDLSPDFWIYSCIYKIFTIPWSVVFLIFFCYFSLQKARLVLAILSTSEANLAFIESLTVLPTRTILRVHQKCRPY